MVPASRQDVQNIADISRNQTLSRIPTKAEFNQLFDNVRNLITLHQQSQQLLKQSEYQRSQLSRRAVALEARLVSLETEIRNTQYFLSKLAERSAPPQPMTMPATPEQAARPPATQQQYVYRPS